MFDLRYYKELNTMIKSMKYIFDEINLHNKYTISHLRFLKDKQYDIGDIMFLNLAKKHSEYFEWYKTLPESKINKYLSKRQY